MLNRVRLRNGLDEIADLYATDSNMSGREYHLVDVEGLGPPEADISYSNFTILDGGVYHNSRLHARNIVLTVEYNLDRRGSAESVLDLRRKLHRVASPRTTVRVNLYNDGPFDMWINGYVETHESPIFSKNPQVQISILCPEPAFLDPNESVVNIPNTNPVTVNYSGDFHTGLSCEITIPDSPSWVALHNRTSGSTLRMRSPQFQSGRRIQVLTEQGNRDVVLRESNGEWVTRILGGAEVTNDWPCLSYGANQLQISTSTTSSASASLTYRTKYLGF